MLMYGYLCSWEQGIEHPLATARRTGTKVVALAKPGLALLDQRVYREADYQSSYVKLIIC